MDLSPLHLHLMLNHVPVLGTVFVAILLAWGLLRGSRMIIRFALGATIALALATVPVFLTGEPAEHQLRDVDSTFVRGSMAHDLAHEHEERGELAYYVMLATGVIALGALWITRHDREDLGYGQGRGIRRGPATVALLALLVTFALMFSTALLGGRVRHPELRPAGAER